MQRKNNGCSTCLRGKEQFEEKYSATMRKKFMYYEYHTHKGELFSSVTKTLKQARQRKDKWLAKRAKEDNKEH